VAGWWPIAQAQGGRRLGIVLPQHFFGHRVPHTADFGIGKQPVLKNLFRPQAFTAVNQRDPGGMMRQIKGLFHGRVAAANHRHMLIAEKEAIAGGAGRNAKPRIIRLAWNAQPLGLGSGGNHDRWRFIHFAAFPGAAEGRAAEIHGHNAFLHNPGANVLRLQTHLLHEPGAFHGGCKAGKILHILGHGQLPARQRACKNDRLQVRACSIDGSGVSCGSGPDDQQLCIHSTFPFSFFLAVP
jgi:hypothetical protein